MKKIIYALIVTLVPAAATAAPPDRAELEREVQALPFTSDSWRRDLHVAADLSRRLEPELAARLTALEGLDRRRYLARRRPEPEVGRELSRLAAERGAAPIILELALSPETYPAALAPKERRALAEGAVLALAKTGHPAAPFALESIALDETRDEGVRGTALLALGETRAPFAAARLEGIAATETAPLALRVAAIAGLGYHHDARVLEALAVHARAEHAALRTAAYASIATAASARVRGNEALAARASAILIAALHGAREETEETRIIEALTIVATDATRAELQRARAASEGAVQTRLARAEARVAKTLRRR